jgi:hypothetical protein
MLKLDYTEERLTRRTGLILINRFGETINLEQKIDRPTWINKFYQSTPWDIIDIEACLSRKEDTSCDTSFEPRFENHEKVRQSLLSLEHKPGYSDPLIYLLTIENNGLLFNNPG